MNSDRLKIALALAATIYVAMLWLFWIASWHFSTFPELWCVWFISGGMSLAIVAFDLSWLLMWLINSRRAAYRKNLVPLRLEAGHRTAIRQARPRVALIVPANSEANTKDDATALANRLLAIARNALVPSRCRAKLIVLFDTDITRPQARAAEANERGLVDWVNLQLRQLGLGNVEVDLREYRNKPKQRRSKPGSIATFLEQEAEDYDFIMVLDADSSFPPPDVRLPDTLDGLDRLVAAMLAHPDLAMIQCGMRIEQYDTLLGWLQHVQARLAINYHGRLNGFILGPEQPSYGHNVMFRRTDLQVCYETGIPLRFLSHDFIEAAYLASNGRWCISTMDVATEEEPESTADTYLQRDQRWQRGNAQWAHFLFSYPGVALGAWYSLGMGILNYLLPLAASVFLITSTALLMTQGFVMPSDIGPAAMCLLGAVLVGLIAPKVASCFGPSSRDRLSPTELITLVFIGAFVAAPYALYAGVLFFLAPLLGEGWKLRGSRQTHFGPAKALYIAKQFLPASLLGAGLLVLGWTQFGTEFGSWIILFNLVTLILSPLAALVVSWPGIAKAAEPNPTAALPAPAVVERSASSS